LLSHCLIYYLTNKYINIQNQRYPHIRKKVRINGGITTSKGLRKETGHAFLVTVLRVVFGITVFNAGIAHLLGGQGAFVGALLSQGTAVGSWVAANAGFMFPLVVTAMLLTGLSLVFGIFARLGSIVLALFAIFFIIGMNSWIGNLAMLGAAVGFIIVGPGRYYGLDIWVLKKWRALKILA
jgi:uncharacterized membrane protein YphA (DoxX/SURF4 family)